MNQRMIIQLLPIQVLLLSLAAGWVGAGAVKGLLTSAEASLLEPAPALSVVSGEAGLGQRPVASARASVLALAPVFTPEVKHWQDKIVVWSQVYGLDPNLVATVMQIESCGAPRAESYAGAQGLFQVMPFHFADGEDMQDPDTNAARGLAYLALGLERAGGNAGLALAGYNGGHGVIGLDASSWAEETRNYWYWGSGIYAEAAGGQPASARLQEWLQAGGASLCAQASEQIGGV